MDTSFNKHLNRAFKAIYIFSFITIILAFLGGYLLGVSHTEQKYLSDWENPPIIMPIEK